MKKIVLLLTFALILSCSKENGSEPSTNNPDSFNRKEMLTFWADDIIIPAYTDFSSKTAQLKTTVDAFIKNPTTSSLADARNKWEQAYLSWQKVSLFQVGKAAEFNMVATMNTYPTDESDLSKYVAKGDYNLDSPNLYDVQGFPALDYLLNGKDSDTETVQFFKENKNYQQYTLAITDRINTLANSVLNDWKTSYRTIFIEKDDYTTTSSVDKMVNFYIIPFYEKQFRNNKVSIPAGIATGTPVSKNVEAYYKRDISKKLYQESLQSAINFYKGIGFNGSKGKSLQQYLEFLKREDLATLINTKFDNIQKLSQGLDDDFVKQIATDRNEMLALYDAIQDLLKSFKPDMMSAMSVMNTSTDADND